MIVALRGRDHPPEQPWPWLPGKFLQGARGATAVCRPALAQSEEREQGNDDNDRTNDIDDSIHGYFPEVTGRSTARLLTAGRGPHPTPGIGQGLYASANTWRGAGSSARARNDPHRYRLLASEARAFIDTPRVGVVMHHMKERRLPAL